MSNLEEPEGVTQPQHDGEKSLPKRRGHHLAFRSRRLRLQTRWSWWVARRFRYRGVYLVGRDVPDVAECHRTYVEGHSCTQHDGSHVHEWVWCAITYKDGSHPQWAWRCLVCGGRKCDMACSERRHHHGPHHETSGFRQVGQ